MRGQFATGGGKVANVLDDDLLSLIRRIKSEKEFK